MPKYTIAAYHIAHNDRVEEATKKVTELLADPKVVDSKLELSASTRYSMEISVEDVGLNTAMSQVAQLAISKRVNMGFRSWKGWYSGDILRTARRRLESRYTAAEVASPQIIMETPVPETVSETITEGGELYDGIRALSPQEETAFIKRQRTRYRSLLRLQLAQQFAAANPGVQFLTPTGMNGTTILRTINGLGITFSSVRNRMHVKSDLANLDQWLEAADSHQFQALLQHQDGLVEHARINQTGTHNLMGAVEASHVALPVSDEDIPF